ncbi:GNAT family N-acetyltransferase [Paenibacillus sp. UNC451MF]|uniref:GNAT family N-acetyltransferase n=1 Tax=Paenibacillus sp. UNC451MF TaxID=1449063 RepID=UPI00048DBBF7|nr:GNAT family N-acetyltransferase [Paenibacillus sp. UNC451MF]
MSSNLDLEQVQIVEYDPIYAQQIAAMWNESHESWGGSNRVRTAESVVREIENAGYLKLFLAIIHNKVVGYCSFSHYKNDEGALYVPLLNVSPSYHGRKIGKSLILKAVQTTIEMGWPRLDLFTWAGNTKAVPMYKKCGFFWEKKENSVHLMNFIPTVLQTEALEPYWDKLDWYADSVRSLDIAPDGRTESGFDYFEYVWEKNGVSLRVEFEKTARGMRLIETDDYSIHTEIDEHALVFGSSYPVRYVIRNKTGRHLDCTVRGISDKNIRFELDETVSVHDKWVVEGEFELDPVQEEQSDWKTHPAVTTEWTINGRKALFRTGIAPKFPAKVKLEVQGQEQYTDVQGEAFVTFENNYNVQATFEFTLPPSSFITYDIPQVKVDIPAKGKVSVPISYRLNDFGLYSEDVLIKTKPNNLPEVSYRSKLHSIFKGNSGQYGGDALDHWVAVNGPYTLGLNKKNNDFWVSHFNGGNQHSWLYPRMGRPYSLEFMKKPAESVKVFTDGDTVVIEADYVSDDFPGITLTAYGRLQSNGIVERYFKVYNGSSESLSDDLFLNDTFYFEWKKLVLPYDGHYYDLADQHASDSDDWELNRISEHWMFSRAEKLSFGFYWDSSAKLIKTEWHFGIEYNVGRLAEGESYRTPSTFLTIGTYTDWWDFRSYALKRREAIRPLLRDHCELLLKNRNPFTRSDAIIELRQHRRQPLDGKLSLSSTSAGFEQVNQTYEQTEEMYAASFLIADQSAGEIGAVHMEFEAADLTFERSVAFIPISNTPTVQEIGQGEAGELYRCDNGILSIEASPAFGSALHSLKYQGEEWLDSSFPVPGPRSWSNPWLGGISASIQGMSSLTQLEEPRSAEFVTLMDSFGNEWRGIELRTWIRKHEKNRGLELSLFTLLLPSAPVLCYVTRLTNRSGLSYNQFRSTVNTFLHPDRELTKGWAEKDNDIRYRCGKVGLSIQSEGVIRFGSDDRSTLLHAVSRHPGSNASLYTNNLLIEHRVSQNVPLLDGNTVWGSPGFIIFGNTPFTYKQLQGLVDIRFDEAHNQGGRNADY